LRWPNVDSARPLFGVNGVEQDATLLQSFIERQAVS
jgi:hypothetical protein